VVESLEIARRAFEEADLFIGTAPSPLFVGSLEVLKYLSEAKTSNSLSSDN